MGPNSGGKIAAPDQCQETMNKFFTRHRNDVFGATRDVF
jgi:hypothetical protein